MTKEELDYVLEKVHLPYKVGFEYTYIKLDVYIYPLINDRMDISHEIYANKIKVHVGTDHGAIEINTTPTSSIRKLIHEFTVIDKIMRAYGYIVRDMDHVDGGGGGGHLHIDIPKGKFTDTYDYIAIMIDFIYYMPYLSWLFLEPCDNINAVALHKILSKGEIKHLGNIVPNVLFNTKDAVLGIKNDTNTLEFRCFDTPENVDELITNILVVYFIHTLVEANVWYIRENFDSYASNCKRCVNAFQSHINMAANNLDIDRYQIPFFNDTIMSYVKKNLNVRFQYGKNYLN